MQLRDYQLDISSKGVDILKRFNILYLAMEVRTGKTFTALEVCRLYDANKVLFLTKKKAIHSIQRDASHFDFETVVINNESIHKIDGDFDVVIHDESHRFGSYPKPSVGAKEFKKRFSSTPLILLSGTPTPESYSQIYHQLWVSGYSPLSKWSNFYQFAHEFVSIKDRHLGYAVVKDYSNANEAKIKPLVEHLFITHTQKESGFSSSVNETVLYCGIEDRTLRLIERLKKDFVIEGKQEVILADTAVKMMQKLHQLYSGTCKFESGNAKVFDLSKANFIRDHFKGKKIGIFYKFKAELEALRIVFGDSLTQDVEEFDNSDKNVALQIISGREGISLKSANYLVFYNIDFSATSYFQAIDRMTTMDRLKNDVFWIFTKGGIEERIYKSVKNKKDYTLNYFKKDYGIKVQTKSNRSL